jgi:hypothetical protein
MRKDPGNFLTLFQRALACMWAAIGLWVLFSSLRHFESLDLYTTIGLTVGTAFAISSVGLFLDKGWGRIGIGCLMVVVLLWSADMVLFIAIRGLDGGRKLLLGLVVAFTAASVCTWSVLAATRREFQ